MSGQGDQREAFIDLASGGFLGIRVQGRVLRVRIESPDGDAMWCLVTPDELMAAIEEVGVYAK